MTQLILSQLRSQLDSEAKIIPWEQIDIGWRERITRAIGNEGHPACITFPETEAGLSVVIRGSHSVVVVSYLAYLA